MTVMNRIQKEWCSEGTDSQKAAMQFFCATGQTVSITTNSETVCGKIVQYVTFFPENNNYRGTFLFFRKENSEFESFEWTRIKEISCDNISPGTINNIKSLVAHALISPQPQGATAALIEAVSEKKESLKAIYDTLDSPCKTILKSRLITEYLDRKLFEAAAALYDEMSSDKIRPCFQIEYFDFSVAILGLVKAGIIKDGLKKEMQAKTYVDTEGDEFAFKSLTSVDFQRGVGFAIRETQPKELTSLHDRYISSLDVEKARNLRQDTTVQVLARKLNLDKLFDLSEKNRL